MRRSHLPHLLLATLLLLLALPFAGAQEQRYYLYGGGQFAPDQRVELYTWLSDRPATDLILYRVENPQDVLSLGGPSDFDLTSGLELTEVAAREVMPNDGTRSIGIDLGVLPVGMYVAQLGPEETGSATVVLVTNLALISKWDGERMLIYTSDLTTGEPVPAQLTAAFKDGVRELQEGPDGLTAMPVTAQPNTNSGVGIAARFGDSWAFSTSVWNSWSADIPTIYLVTDRPVYRPGQEVHIKGTMRLARSVKPVAGEQVTVTVEDADYEELLTTTLRTDEFGSVNVDLDLPAGAPLGYYSLRAEFEGVSNWSSFWVEEYTKPEYEVEVTADVPYAIQGDSASFTVSAEYLFGGPVGGGTVDYVVMSEPYSRWAWRSEYGFYGDYSSTFGGEVIDRGQATLGADGQLVIPVQLQRQDRDYRLTLQARVSDESEANISGSASMVAYRANLVLGVQTDRYAHPFGEQIAVTVTAQDLEGNPISTDFSIETERRYWVEDVGEQVAPGESLTGTTNLNGTATILLNPDQAGSWRITAGASDAQGRYTDSIESVWVFGGDAWYWDYQFLEVKTDKEEYEVGDIARFVIQSPVADGWALVTIEGGTLADWELIRFEGNSFTFELPVTARDLPDSSIAVAVVGDGQIYHAATSYRIDPGSRFLDVQIESSGDTFEPGSSTELEILVTDAVGQPVEAQLTVALVDEAIYLIRGERTPDIRGFFYATHGNNVRTDLSTYAYFGQIAPAGAAREAMDEAVFAQAKDSAAMATGELAEAEIRENFRDTILWLPEIVTDADGRATIDVEFPDNLTRWRLTARAITRDGLVGQATHTVTTTLPVIARLAMPGYAVRGDDLRIRLIGQSNLSADADAEFGLTATGLDLSPASDTDLSLVLPATGRSSVDWLAHAASVGTVNVQGEVLSAEASDALRVPLQVVPHAVSEELVWAASGTSEWEITLPDTLVTGSLRGSVLLTPDFTSAVTPALDWLVGLDYGYTELTVSRLLATVMTAEAGLPLPADVTDLDMYVDEGLSRLYQLQHPDGGWGFGRFDVSNPAISAFVISGLLDLREAGFDIRSWELGRGLDYIEAASGKDSYQVFSGIDDEAARATAVADAKAYMWLALAKAGRQVHQLSVVAGDPALSNYGLALSVLAYEAMGSATEADLYLDELLSRVVDGGATAHWNANAPRYTWGDDTVETTALALQALASLRPQHELISRAVNWLLLERSGSHWYSSKDTLAVVRTALQLEAATRQPEGEAEVPPVTVRLNGIVIAEVELADEQVEVELTGLTAQGRNRLEITAPEDGWPYVSSSLTFMVEEPFDSPVGQGILVERDYELLTPVWVESEQHYEYERSPADSVQVGDFVVATVTLTPSAELRYVLVNEPVPAGFNVVEDDYSFRLAGIPRRYGDDYWGWNYWYDDREIRDRSIDYWFSRLEEPVSFTHILRAEHPGEYAALPSQARLLYERDTYGRSAAQRLTVSE